MLLYGFVTWLPTFFMHQGMSIANLLDAPIKSGIGASLAAIVFSAIFPSVMSVLMAVVRQSLP